MRATEPLLIERRVAQVVSGELRVAYSGTSGGESSSSRNRSIRFCRERDGRGGSPSICRNLSPTSAVIARVCIGSSSSRSFCIFANSQLGKSFEAGGNAGEAAKAALSSQQLTHAATGSTPVADDTASDKFIYKRAIGI